MKRIPIPFTLVAIATLSLATTASAAVFCVTNSIELQSALDTAESNGQHDIIRVQTGSYLVSENGNSSFTYDASQQGGDDYTLTLEGGWTAFFGNPCGQLLSQNPLNTMISGEGVARAMRIDIRENSNLSVRSLAFLNGNPPGNSLGGGLAIAVTHDPEGSYTGRILIQRNMFLLNEAYRGGGLWVGERGGGTYTATGNSRIGAANNVFVSNHARLHSGAAVLRLQGGDDGVLGGGIYVTNNTVLNNTGDDATLNSLGAITLLARTPNVYVVDNNMWGNDHADLSVDFLGNGTNEYRLYNNNIGIRKGNRTVTHESNNISVEPMFEACFLCFTWVPVTDSPLIDAGIHPPIFSPFWNMPALDATGNPRIAQGTVDIGAYENHERLFADRFE